MNTYFLTCTYRYKDGAIDGRQELVIQFPIIRDQAGHARLRQYVLNFLLDRHKGVSDLEIHCLSKL